LTLILKEEMFMRNVG